MAGDTLNYEETHRNMSYIYMYIYTQMYTYRYFFSTMLITLVSKDEFDWHQLPYAIGQAERKRPGERNGEE